MFEKLQQKWKVNGTQLVLILCTFAIGGSATGFAARKLMPFLGIGPNWLWITIYIVLVTLIWPLAVLLVSIPFGQFRFFTGYLKKIAHRMGLSANQSMAASQPQSAVSTQQKTDPLHIAIFASGNGSNAKKIIAHFNYKPGATIRVTLIVCNNARAGIIRIAEKENIPVLIIEKENFLHGDGYVSELKTAGIGLVVLAGFLWKIPAVLIKAFPRRIINIHPALLPKYGGLGMYGHHVHQAVIDNKEEESGITIHYVDEVYDHGEVIFQATCPVYANDAPDWLAERVRQLEHDHYARVIEELAVKTTG